MAQLQPNTVIIGAGIMGLSTAFYLSQSANIAASSIVLVECAPELFASASGYAGGFLAKEWFGPLTASLGALSFDLHRRLADDNKGPERWGYSRSKGSSFVPGPPSSKPQTGARGQDWLRQGQSRANAALTHEYADADTAPSWLTQRDGDSIESIDGGEGVAQVDPLRLCKWLLAECQARGVRLEHPASVLSVSKDLHDELASVRIARQGGEEMDLPCSRVVLTAGVWTPQVFSTLFPHSPTKLRIGSLAGHSLVVKSPRWTTENEAGGSHAVFATNIEGFSPEVFSRIGGEIYIAGLNDDKLRPPEMAGAMKPNPSAINSLKKVATRMLGIDGEEDDLEVLREGLCFRPIGQEGFPVISRIPDGYLGDQYAGMGMKTRPGAEGGVFVMSGHGPWGISMSLGSGKCLSELIENQTPSANIASLSL